RILLEMIRQHPEFKISFSFSGVFLEQLEMFMPEVLASFQELVATGNVEILDETYYHSLSFLYSPEEFKHQVGKHKKMIRRLFGLTPRAFRNTELIYNNDLARAVEEMGYKVILAEGADHILGWRSPNFLYRPQGLDKIKLLVKNYKLSDDIAFRFSERSWKEHPLTAGKFAHWVAEHNGNGEVINLFMDYETFGEHQWADTGIFEFLRHLPAELAQKSDIDFVTPSEAAARYRPVGELDAPHFVSWADTERDLSAWLSNDMQREAMEKIYALEEEIKNINDDRLLEDWRRLQTSDHFYYMCTKWWNDGDVHKYFNPYDSPYDAFIAFINALNDVKLRSQNLVAKK
ncbi:MAG: glycoside hydrolase family 57 protein, partial [Candidatus Pacebacteria bacterium]|nr:glycoside hydrolase family 57 protein [Candidatus Paceibacterota bacterium]